MKLDDLDVLCSKSKIDIAMQLNIIDRLCKILETFDIFTAKHEALCSLNYAVLDIMDFIDCLTNSYPEKTQSIIGNEELVVLHQLKKALHNVRHYYYYNEKNFKMHNWFNCNNSCGNSCGNSDDACICPSSIQCVECAIRIYFLDCVDLINKTYLILKDTAQKYESLCSNKGNVFS